MPVSVDWANPEKTIVMQRIDGQWSMAEFYDVVQKSAQLLATVDHPVDIIVDLSTTNFVPQGVISGANKTESTVPPNQRLVIFVGAKMMHKLLLSLGKRLAPRAATHQHFVETMEEANGLIEHFRAEQA
ncbi:hypothetical protein G4Y79_02380 [Phototrophicus methaneseepsis]|uniref:STAS domain-containing protein n=1 Tax=Phototrophicus methaneseepsis TaxID=2710758 RepID=A0A7S8EAH1_9CHLR|nr:hypothetical protein [Phototrophicus methaneseepsis]QPC83243.1 hypothetical protein G4Y79_02380 [Phototrophicus methaneseepsis]